MFARTLPCFRSLAGDRAFDRKLCEPLRAKRFYDSDFTSSRCRLVLVRPTSMFGSRSSRSPVSYSVKHDHALRDRNTQTLRRNMSDKTRIMYVECCSNLDHRGRARICRVRFSKSGRTIYLNGLSLTRCTTTGRPNGRKGAGIHGNYINQATQVEYWVSGPKRNGRDRHWAGTGPVQVEADVVDEYWREIRQQKPPKNPFVT